MTWPGGQDSEILQSSVRFPALCCKSFFVHCSGFTNGLGNAVYAVLGLDLYFGHLSVVLAPGDLGYDHLRLSGSDTCY
jgi:hypothetical protein